MTWRTSSATRARSLSVSSVLLSVSATSIRKVSSLSETSAARPPSWFVFSTSESGAVFSTGLPLPPLLTGSAAEVSCAGIFVRVAAMVDFDDSSGGYRLEKAYFTRRQWRARRKKAIEDAGREAHKGVQCWIVACIARVFNA